jgi:hypothetical protein
MVIDTPFADVKLMVPLPAVAVNFCVLPVKASFVIAVNSAADGGGLPFRHRCYSLLMQLLLKILIRCF